MRVMSRAVKAAAVALMMSSAVVPAAMASGVHAETSARWRGAVSHPVRDSVYPRHSMPDVDALHYGLRLSWAPHLSRLTGREALTFRATHRADRIRLAFGRAMHVRGVRLDGHRVRVTHPGAVLVVHHRVGADSVHRLVLRYAGRPPTAEPPARQRNAVGMFHTRSGDVFTNDEPVGAFRW